jgi:hypothetical protein
MSRTRIPALDAIRGVSVAFMIVVHTLAFYASVRLQTEGVGDVVLQLGKLTAVFVVCMGMSTAFSRRRALRPALLRAAMLLAGGYALNVAKFLPPMLLQGGLPDTLLVDVGLHPGDPANLAFFLFLGDILHMSALSLAVIALLRAAGARPWQVLALAAAVALASPALWGVRVGPPLTAYLCDLLFCRTYAVFFPLFPWLAYALLGMALGDLLVASPHPARTVFRRWAFVGVPLALAGYLVGLAVPWAWKGADFYRSGPAAIASVAGVTLALFWIADVLWERLPGAATRTIAYLSRRVTRLYVVSWLIIVWGLRYAGYLAQDQGGPLAAIVLAVVAATIAVDRAADLAISRPSLSAAPGSSARRPAQ